MTRRIDKITREALIVLGAGPDCDRLAAFVAVFPGGSALTEEAYDRAVAAGLDLAWLAKRILPESARAEFDKAVAPAWAAYDEAVAPSRAEFDKAVAAARAAYDEAVAAARAEFDKAVAPAMKAAYVATFWGAEPNGD